MTHLLPVEDKDRFAFSLDQPIVLTDVDAMVTADWHIPIYDPMMVNAMIETARKERIKKLIIGGDFWNYDALSAYDPKQHEGGLDREHYEGNSVMNVLDKTFDQIVFVFGNHDMRLVRALGYKTAFATAMYMAFGELDARIKKKLRISNLDHCYVDFSEAPVDRRRWRICHPTNYSRIPLSTPRQLAAKHNCNVITAHAHHAAIGYAMDGRKTVAEIGGLFSQKDTAYLQRTTTFPMWTPGYGWFKDGHFRMTTPHWTA